MLTTAALQTQLATQRDTTGTPGIAMGIAHGGNRIIATDGVTNTVTTQAMRDNNEFRKERMIALITDKIRSFPNSL